MNYKNNKKSQISIAHLTLLSLLVVSGCATTDSTLMTDPRIITESDSFAGDDFRRAELSNNNTKMSFHGISSAEENFRNTHKNVSPNRALIAGQRQQVPSLVLSAGDSLKVSLLEGKEYCGVYKIDIDGQLKLPYLEPVTAAGKSMNELVEDIKHLLVSNEIFKADFLDISIKPIEWSAALVSVKGAVFQPGNIMINERDFRKQNQATKAFNGDFANKRLLSSALKAAGGIRPDADLKNIQLVRAHKTYYLDMSGILSGERVMNDPILVQGDQLTVPSVGYVQTELLRPSRITPPGFRVFLSNLTVPAFNNSASAVGKHATSLPLGSRLMTAAVSANCVGGTESVNARRKILLAGIDLNTNKIRVVQRSLDQIYSAPNSHLMNPYLLPNDQIACFDSNLSNWRDIAKGFTEILSPASIILGVK